MSCLQGLRPPLVCRILKSICLMVHLIVCLSPSPRVRLYLDCDLAPRLDVRRFTPFSLKARRSLSLAWQCFQPADRRCFRRSRMTGASLGGLQSVCQTGRTQRASGAAVSRQSELYISHSIFSLEPSTLSSQPYVFKETC